VSDESFDGIDRALAHGLSALAPEVDGGDETLAALRPRFRRARTRRRAAGVGVSLVALAAIGSVAQLAAPDSRHPHVQISAPPSTRSHSPTTKSSTSVSTTTRPDASPRPGSPTPTTAGHSSGPSGPSNPSNPSGGPLPSPTTVPAPVPNGDHGGSGASGADRGGDNGHGGSGPESTTVPPAPEVHTYRSAGGSVTVRFAHGQLQLLGDSASGGYRASVESEQPDDIEIRFDSAQGQSQWRIRVRVDHDGHLTHEVTQG
jgi:hypothetical protein